MLARVWKGRRGVRVRSGAALTLLAVSFAASGCGGGGSSSSASADIEAICARHNGAIAALGVDPVESEGGLRGVQQRRAGIEQATLRELQRLTPGASLQSTWSLFLADRKALINAIVAYSQHRLNGSSVEEAEAAAQAQSKTLAAAKSAGLKECARAG
jgi:hypothetical protein